MVERILSDGARATAAPDTRRQPAGGFAAVVGRLRGPGGLYNIGNAIGLATGLGLQIVAATAAEDGGGALGAVRAYFMSDIGALSLSLAMAVFFWSGETYHRAWRRGYPPDAGLNRNGDLLSALGAAILTVALALAGQTALALVSGALLFAGKLGSAVFPDNYAASGAQKFGASEVCRYLVVASRVPALVALGWEIAVLTSGGAPGGDLVMPAVMFFCYCLWARADLLLFARN